MRFIHGFHNRPNPLINLEPLGDADIQYVLDRENKRFKSVICLPDKELIWGPRLEIGMVETMMIRNEDFEFTECLWQVATPKVSLNLPHDDPRTVTEFP